MNEPMTYIEKLKTDHPDRVGGYHTGGAAGCPCDYGYENGHACEQRKQKTITCRECWERQIKQ